MTKRMIPILLAALVVLAGVLLLTSIPAALGGNNQQDATQQQQTINAVINDRFTQTAAAGATETAPPQGPTLTAMFEQTLDAAFAQALTATAQANMVQDAAGRDLEPITPVNVARLSELVTFNAGATVTHVVFAPDNASVFTAGLDYVVRQWDTATGAEIRQFVGHTQPIRDLAIAPDGTLIATASMDNTVRLWDTATGAAVQTVNTGEEVATALAFNFSGNRLATGSGSGSTVLWEIPGMTLIRRFSTHSDTVRDVAFRPPDGRVIGTVGEDGRARLWETATGQPIRNVAEEVAVLTGIAFSPDGETVAATGQGISPRLWAMLGTIELGAPDNYANITYSPDAQLVATASWVASGLIIWNPATGDQWVTRAPYMPVYDVAFSPNGTMIVTGGDAPRLWGVLPGVNPTPAPTVTPSATPTEAPIETQIALEATTIHQTAVIQQETQAAFVTPTPRPANFPTDVYAELQIAQQSYEKGWMFWFRHNQQIWVATLDESGIFGGDWFCYYDTFMEGEPEVDSSLIPPAEGLMQPHRGFGKVWRDHPDIRAALGWATTPEFELTSAYTYVAGGYLDDAGTFVQGPGEHRITTFSGDSFSFFEQTIRGDCIGGTWHQTR
ncbi:MAG: WD40 repeat domain-containing protein [Anaerolineae bacterium]|nr:WD40 repeat domain-containing protein [Anaerolineae bacterium]